MLKNSTDPEWIGRVFSFLGVPTAYARRSRHDKNLPRVWAAYSLEQADSGERAKNCAQLKHERDAHAEPQLDFNGCPRRGDDSLPPLALTHQVRRQRHERRQTKADADGGVGPEDESVPGPAADWPAPGGQHTPRQNGQPRQGQQQAHRRWDEPESAGYLLGGRLAFQNPMGISPRIDEQPQKLLFEKPAKG